MVACEPIRNILAFSSVGAACAHRLPMGDEAASVAGEGDPYEEYEEEEGEVAMEDEDDDQKSQDNDGDNDADDDPGPSSVRQEARVSI